MTETITHDGKKYHVHAYLNDIRSRMDDIKACEQRIDEAERRLGLMGVAYSDLPGDPNAYGDAIPDGVIRLIEARERLADEVALHNAEIDRAWELCRPQGSENRYLLWLRHVRGMAVGKVCKARCLSRARAYRMMSDGVEELYAAMPEEWRGAPPAI